MFAATGNASGKNHYSIGLEKIVWRLSSCKKRNKSTSTTTTKGISRMGKMQRNKGAGGEREAIKVLGDHLGTAIEGRLKRNLAQTRDGGADLLGLGAWRIEVKRARIKRMAPWWTQAVEQVDEGRWPVVMYRIDFSREWRVCVHISDLSPTSFSDWPKEDLSGVVELSVQAFAAIVREHLAPAWAEKTTHDIATAAREVC